MFESKKKQLFTAKEKQEKTTSVKQKPSAFVQAGLKKGAEVLSGNGALKYSTTGNPFVDQFGKVGEYKKPRPFAEIAKDCEELWAVDKLDTVKMAFYIRMISRTLEYQDAKGESHKSEVPQRGAELKHEGIMRIIWLASKDLNAFVFNLPILPMIGSWKDIFTMLQYDLVYHGWGNRVLPWSRIGNLILAALRDSSQSELVKKYLPSIQANGRCTTIEAQADNLIAKWICGLLYPSYKETTASDEQHAKYQASYRRLKSSGTAHEWQKLISKKQFTKIDFSKIHGRALSLLVRSKFLKRQGLQDKYEAWIKKPTTQQVKYTGFVHELFMDLGKKYSYLSNIPIHVQETINKQFNTLVEKGKGKGTEVEKVSTLIVVRDTSGSMASESYDIKMSSNDIAKSLALYFSEFLQGKFANSWIEFSSGAQLHQWKGNTVLEKWYNDRAAAGGSTNFQSVIELFCNIKRQGIPEIEFPTGILCISDGEFDKSSLGQTNIETARTTLRKAGFSKEYIDNFVIVLWNIPNKFYGSRSSTKFETFGDARNVFYYSGFSASVVAFLTSGKPIQTSAELVAEALNQEVLNLIKI